MLADLVTHPSPSLRRRSVKVIRLIGRDTVEEMVCGKAAAKLQLASTVVEGGHLALGTQKPAAGAGLQVQRAVLHFRTCQVYSRCSLRARKYREGAGMTTCPGRNTCRGARRTQRPEELKMNIK